MRAFKYLHIYPPLDQEDDEINRKLSSTIISLLTKSPYATHPQAVYTSKILDFENLPEPKNADDDDLFETEYSGN